MSSFATLIDADAVIGAEYDSFKDEVTRSAAGKLAASNIRFADIDMDGFYNQAWYGLYTKLQDGQQVDNRKGLLIQMTYRRAIDEYRTLHPDRQADPVMLETVGVDNPIEETLDQQREFKQFTEGMRSSLSQRELQAATLCYVYGLSRPEAAEQVGVRPKRMEKIMDEVSRKLRPVLASIKEGTWCEDRAVLINQFALGALDVDSDEYREAVDHLADCPGCRRHVLGTRGLTAVTIPSGLLLLALTGAATAGAAGVAAASSGAGTAGGASAGGGAAAAGGGAGIGGAVQIAAVVAAIATVAAGGFVAVNKISGDDSTPAPATAPESQSADNAAAKAAAAKKAAAKKKAKKKSAAKRKVKKAAAVEAQTPAPQPQVQQPAQTAPAPAEQKATPSNPSTDSGEEFDLQ
jgi:DNA-directed RNA polymerase specialized sigma24 family protein